MLRKIAFLAMVIVLLFLVSYTNAALPTVSQTTAKVNNVSTSTIQVTPTYLKNIESKILSNIKNSKVPLKYVMLPNFSPSNLNKPGTLVHPGYSFAPAPMGLGFYGILNQSGQLVGMNFTSPSYEATVTVNNLSDFNLVDDGPYSVTFQLNAVLKNVTLFGNNSYNFWTQNVVFYSARTHELLFLDNIWNFSSPAFYMSPNVFYQHGPNGNLVAPTFYYAIGPEFTVQYPFSLSLYLNSTLINGRSAIFFNYSISNGGKTTSGSFDYAIFNSTYGMPSNYSAPAPTYLVSGNTITPTGFIPYDAEIMIGGPGGGSTADILNINATMSLQYLSSGSYVNVPSAYDVGSETGETSTGVSVSYSTAGQAQLTTGPSFVYPLWGMGNQSFSTFSGTVNPTNTFLMVTPGSSFNSSLAQWAPLSMSGGYEFKLPTGQYTATYMLSNYNPVNGTLSSFNGKTVNLVQNMSMGVYTPLMAFNNAQLKSIVYPVNATQSLIYGTELLPMVLYDNSIMFNPVFSQVNDYSFPVFPAVWLMNTNKYVVIKNEPSFTIQPNMVTAAIYNFFGIPLYNSLGYWLYNTSNIELTSNYVSGYYSKYLAGFPAANMIIWNSTNDIVFNNYFNVSDSSLLIYNQNSTMSGNIVDHNYFVASPWVYTAVYGAIDMNSFTSGIPVALYAFSTGNMIYDNYFSEPLVSVEIPYNIYNGFPAIYYNQWNISSTQSAKVGTFNGYNLDTNTNVIGGSYVSGNYWWNFNGFLPFNDSGFITVGGDYSPEQFPYTISVQESGLGISPFWYGEIPNALYTANFGYIPELVVSTFSSLSFGVNNGTYEVLVLSPGYNVVQSFPLVRVNGQSQTLYATFQPILYSLTFTEVGLPAGEMWSVTVDGNTYSTASNNITVNLPAGTYSYSYSSLPGYKLTNGSGTVTLNMSGQMVMATYTQEMYQVTFQENGLSSGMLWTVTFNGMSNSSVGNTISFMVPNGTYFYSISPVSGYVLSDSSGLISVNGNNITVEVYFSAIPPAPSPPAKYTVEFIEVGLPANTTWSIAFNGATSTSTSSISFSAMNGTYTYQVGSISGYATNVSSGVVAVNGQNIVVTIYFHKVSTPSVSPYTPQGIVIGFLLGFLLTIIVMAIALVAGRRKKQ